MTSKLVRAKDGDSKTSGRLAPAEQALNAIIAETAGEERGVVLDSDFEAVAGKGP